MGKYITKFYSWLLIVFVFSIISLKVSVEFFPQRDIFGDISIKLLALSLFLILIFYLIIVIYFEKKASPVKFVRNLTPEEREEKKKELSKYERIASYIYLSSVFIILAVFLLRMLFISDYLNDYWEGIFAWIGLLTLIFSGIIFVGSIHQLDKKRALEKDFKEGVHSISALVRPAQLRNTNTKVKENILRAGKYELLIDNQLLAPQIIKDIESEKQMHIEFFAGTQKIIKIEPRPDQSKLK